MIVETITWSTSAAARAGVVERAPARLGGELGERLAVVEDAPLADAGAAHDPLVGRVEALDELGVGDDALGERGADAEDPGLQAAAALGAAGGGRRVRAGAAVAGRPVVPECDVAAIRRPPACA